MTIREIPARKILDWIKQHGSLGKVRRQWAPVDRQDGTMSIFPLHDFDYLYRGQTVRRAPCVSTICRPTKIGNQPIGMGLQNLTELPRTDLLHLIVRLCRANWFTSLLKQHPVLRWGEDNGIFIDRMALAQHYGILTGYIDLTESLEIAAFFATHRHEDGTWRSLDKGRGILYRLDWINANENVRRRANPIGIQPFARPRSQWAWVFEMLMGEDLEAFPGLEAVEFEQDKSVGDEILRIVSGSEAVFPEDPIAQWAAKVNDSRLLPSTLVKELIVDITQDPNGFKCKNIDQLMQEIETAFSVKLTDDVPTPFDSGALGRIEKDWDRQRSKFVNELNDGFQLLLIRSRKKI